MGDPLAIFSATVTAMDICGKVLRYADCISNTDTGFDSLKRQTQGLSNVLHELYTSFKQPIVMERINASQDENQQNGDEGVYWRSVKQSIDDCQKTLQNLEFALRHGVRSILRPIRLKMGKNDIDKYFQEINFIRETLNLALQWLTLYFSPLLFMFSTSAYLNYRSSGLRNERFNVQVTSQLDAMLLKINSILESLEYQRRSGISQHHYPSLENLRYCVESAQRLASHASQTVKNENIIEWVNGTCGERDGRSPTVQPLLCLSFI